MMVLNVFVLPNPYKAGLELVELTMHVCRHPANFTNEWRMQSSDLQ